MNSTPRCLSSWMIENKSVFCLIWEGMEFISNWIVKKIMGYSPFFSHSFPLIHTIQRQISSNSLSFTLRVKRGVVGHFFCSSLLLELLCLWWNQNKERREEREQRKEPINNGAGPMAEHAAFRVSAALPFSSSFFSSLAGEKRNGREKGRVDVFTCSGLDWRSFIAQPIQLACFMNSLPFHSLLHLQICLHFPTIAKTLSKTCEYFWRFPLLANI